jgi:hypothetical protein
MKWWHILMIMDENKGGDGDSGGGGGVGDLPVDVKALQAEIAELKAKLNPPKEPELKDQVDAKHKEKEREADLESALKFNLTAKDFVKTHASLLPKDAPDYLEAAEKENYDSQVEKSNAVKIGIMQSFFDVQENLDLLTASQKNQIEEFQKLTKNGKQARARFLFDNIFEPTLENLKRIKKAEELAKGPQRSTDEVQKRYEQKLIEASNKQLLRRS